MLESGFEMEISLFRPLLFYTQFPLYFETFTFAPWHSIFFKYSLHFDLSKYFQQGMEGETPG